MKNRMYKVGPSKSLHFRIELGKKLSKSTCTNKVGVFPLTLMCVCVCVCVCGGGGGGGVRNHTE